MQRSLGSLNTREFLGTVLPDPDPLNRGRYKVFIPALQANMKGDNGIFCVNHAHKYRMSPSAAGRYGSYFPIQPGTLVVVKFFNDLLESAYIDRIVSDHHVDSFIHGAPTVERDETYHLILTPKYKNCIVINENTSFFPQNSIHIYFNQYRTTLIVDEVGIHVYTSDNFDKVITLNNQVEIKGWSRTKILGTSDDTIVGAHKELVQGGEDKTIQSGLRTSIVGGESRTVVGGLIINVVDNKDVLVTGNYTLNASGIVGIKGSQVNIEASSIGLNGSVEISGTVTSGPIIANVSPGGPGSPPSVAPAAAATPAIPPQPPMISQRQFGGLLKSTTFLAGQIAGIDLDTQHPYYQQNQDGNAQCS